MAVALADYAITTDAKVIDYLNIQSALTVEQTDWLITQINSVSGFIENYCQRKIAVQDVSGEISNGTGRYKLRTLWYPITQISVTDSPTSQNKLDAIQFRDDVDSAWENIETNVNNIIINSPKDYQVTDQTTHNIELLETVFPSGTQNIKVSYRTGITSPEIDEIEQVVIEMVVMRYKESERKGKLLGVTSVNDSIAGRSGNIIYKDLMPRWKEVLDRYKRRI